MRYLLIIFVFFLSGCIQPEPEPEPITEIEDRLDTVCGNRYAVACLVNNNMYHDGNYKRNFVGCGCGDTTEEAISTMLTGLVNSYIYVDFEFLTDTDGTKEERIDRVFSYRQKMEKKMMPGLIYQHKLRITELQKEIERLEKL